MRSPRARAPDTLPLAPPPAQVPGSPGPRLPEQAGGLAQGPHTFPTTQGCPARSLVDSASGPGSRRPALCQRGLCTLVSVCAHPRALPEGCMTAQQGGFLRKSRTHTGGAGARGAEPACRHHSTSCSMRPGLRAPSPTGRSRGRGPHLSADLDTTLFIPKPLTLSQHGPPGATHQGCSPDSWRNTGPGARGPPGASGRCSLPTPGPRSSLRKDHCC